MNRVPSVIADIVLVVMHQLPKNSQPGKESNRLAAKCALLGGCALVKNNEPIRLRTDALASAVS